MKSMTERAVLYDSNSPNALGLQAFDTLTLTPLSFKEAIRQTFGLNLKGKELGALFSHFSKGSDSLSIDSNVFLKTFLQLGIAERHKSYAKSIEKTRVLELERKATERKNMLLTGTKSLSLDMEYTVEDKRRAIELLNGAAEAYDRSSSSCLPLTMFEGATMTPALFKESLRSCFGLTLSVREVSYLVSIFRSKVVSVAEASDVFIDCKKFVNQFLKTGTQLRSTKHLLVLEKQRAGEHKIHRESRKKNELISEGEDFLLDLCQVTWTVHQTQQTSNQP